MRRCSLCAVAVCLMRVVDLRCSSLFAAGCCELFFVCCCCLSYDVRCALDFDGWLLFVLLCDVR